jgi:SAM-dependent methyltransferase
MKNFDQNVYQEIFEFNQYEKLIQIEQNDLVLDLGCSKGYLYFKTIQENKQVDYIGLDASIFCLQDFIENLEQDHNLLLLNLAIDKDIKTIDCYCMFHDGQHQLVQTITFKNLINLISSKIDFLKFDIEGYEKYIFEDLDFFKNNIHKFAGELHFNSNIFPRHEVYNFLDNLRQDLDIEFNLFSLDAFDITNLYWDQKDRFTEIIINGRVR